MSSAGKIKMAGFDDLFGSGTTENEVMEVSLSELYSFHEHPFKVLDNDEMDELVESIRLHGKVLNPALVRPRAEGGYELISGHRRCHASKLLGLSTMPVIVRNMTDEEATLIMVDSNIQREHLLYSEKAFAYKMKFEALNHQGSKMDRHTYDEMGENAGESGRNIQRYIRLTELIPELLKLLDEGKMGFGVAVDLSFLEQQSQREVNELVIGGVTVNGRQSAMLKKASQEGNLSYEAIVAVLLEKKPIKRKVILKNERLSQYFTEDYTDADIEEIIFSLLEKWKG